MTFVRVCAKFDYLTLVTSATYGGNPEQIFLVGHSAGGHLVLCTMLQQIMKHMVRDAYASFLTSSIVVFYLPISCFKRTLVLIYYHFLHIQMLGY